MSYNLSAVGGEAFYDTDNLIEKKYLKNHFVALTPLNYLALSPLNYCCKINCKLIIIGLT